MNSLLMTHFSEIGKTMLVMLLDFLETGCLFLFLFLTSVLSSNSMGEYTFQD